MIRVPLPIDPLHPAFAGHFPSRPIVPGVVLLDESLRAIVRHRDAGPAACTVGAAKFLSMVGPGEPVRLEFEPGAGPAAGAYRLQVFAGLPGHERIAISGNVTFDRPDIGPTG